MCYQEILQYKCGHEEIGGIHACPKYDEKKAEVGFLRKFFHKPSACEFFRRTKQDVRTVCSVTCAKRMKDLRKQKAREWRMQERELKKRERARKERARDSASEYRKNKREEEEVWRLWKEDRERTDGMHMGKESLGKSEEPTPNKTIQPLWETARGGTEVYTRTSGQSMLDRSHPARVDLPRAPPRLDERRVLPQASPAKQPPLPPTRVEAQRAPPRLADRQILPQASRANTPTNPQPPRTQANPDALGRPSQGKQRQPRMPRSSTKETASSLARSNGRHLRRDDAGTLDDPRSRIKAAVRDAKSKLQAQNPPVQSVAAKKPVKVRQTTGLPAPSRAQISSGTLSRPTASSRARTEARAEASQPSRSACQPGPPVPPKDKPAVPPKDPWRPQNPSLAPPPLALSPKPAIPPKAPERAVRPSGPAPSGKLTGYRADPTTTVPARKPVGASAAPSRTQERPQPSAAVTGYKPNPMFANKQGKKPAEQVSDARGRPTRAVPSSSRTPAGPASRAPAAARPAAAKPKTPAKQDQRLGWLKRLVTANQSTESVEWVSQDAARIERGPSRGPPKVR